MRRSDPEAGFSDTDSGSIRFRDRPMNGVSPQDRNTALIFQNYALWPHLTVFENVACVIRSTYLGSKNRWLLRLADGTEIKAWVAGHYPEGASVSCRVAPDRCLLFEYRALHLVNLFV